MPDDLKARVQAAAEASNRSLNAEIVSRLEASFGGDAVDLDDAKGRIDTALAALHAQADKFEAITEAALAEMRRNREAYAKALRFVLDNHATLPQDLLEKTVEAIVELPGHQAMAQVPAFHEDQPEFLDVDAIISRIRHMGIADLAKLNLTSSQWRMVVARMAEGGPEEASVAVLMDDLLARHGLIDNADRRVSVDDLVQRISSENTAPSPQRTGGKRKITIRGGQGG
ncbi:Arc family DNA-binding protein [Neotabrizicola sp. sgz301269]|uniref:Arc family DNA-binding protein n=1 Tax=Neotabrizicola sp. sgz301269 TaxID=3276282 RepID=UPI0037700E43